MKKTWMIIVAVILVATVAGGIIWFRSTPEYALITIFKEVNEYGADGLRPYLTNDAQGLFDGVNALADNKLVNALVGLFDLEDDVALLKDNLQNMEWDMVDIMKGDNNAVAILSFKYDEDVSGTVEISMIKTEKEWKIDDIELPEFDK